MATGMETSVRVISDSSGRFSGARLPLAWRRDRVQLSDVVSAMTPSRKRCRTSSFCDVAMSELLPAEGATGHIERYVRKHQAAAALIGGTSGTREGPQCPREWLRDPYGLIRDGRLSKVRRSPLRTTSRTRGTTRRSGWCRAEEQQRRPSRPVLRRLATFRRRVLHVGDDVRNGLWCGWINDSLGTSPAVQIEHACCDQSDALIATPVLV